MIKNLLLAQSGGPTSVINASLSGAITESIRMPNVGKVYGALHGIEGILKKNIIRLDNQFEDAYDFKRLESTPSSALGSCRFKMPTHEENPAIYEQITAVLKQLDIGYFLYIGGNDSMDTVNKLSKYFALVGEDIKAVGIPKTIDNDLAVTDHCPGYGTAAKYIATVMQEIIRDAKVYPVKSVTIVEIMGRNTGWLTAAGMLPRLFGTAAPDLIYLPEIPFDNERFIREVGDVFKSQNTVVVAVSEGVKNAAGEYVASAVQSGESDAFGHKYLAGVGKFLERLVLETIGCKVRSIELNVMQRSSAHLLSETDVIEARRVGSLAVRRAAEGETGIMLSFERISNKPYVVDIRSAKLDEVANLEKRFPVEWIAPSGHDLTQEALEYMLPLIAGEVATPMKYGIPVHFEFDKTLIRL